MKTIFDLDGTLLDHEFAQAGGLEALTSGSADFADRHINLADEWMVAERVHYPRFERGEISFQEHRRERLRHVFPEKCGASADNELDQIYARYLEGYRANWRLYDDVLPVLESLDRSSLGLITNGDRELQRAKIERLGLNEIFSDPIISGEVGFSKPDARIFKLACERLRVDPTNARYIGDNFNNDIRGSKLAGLDSTWVNRFGLPRPDADFSFQEVRSLTEIIKS